MVKVPVLLSQSELKGLSKEKSSPSLITAVKSDPKISVLPAKFFTVSSAPGV